MTDLKRKLPGILLYPLLLLLVVLILLPLIPSGNWFKSHEDLRYLFLFKHFKELFLNGFFYPRWIPDCMSGYGHPLFVFYQPGIFYLALPISLLVADYFTVGVLVLSLLFFLGALGAVCLFSEMSGSGKNIFWGVLFVTSPYLFVNLYIRGDLSELMAILISPWPFYFLFRLERAIDAHTGKAAAYCLCCAGGLAAVVFSHPAIAMFVMGFFCWMSATLIIEKAIAERRRGFSLAYYCVWAVLLSLVVSSPYWLTVFRFQNFVRLDNASEGVYYAPLHCVYPWQFFSTAWQYGGSQPGWENDTMPMPLGLVQFALALAGFFCARRSMRQISIFAFYVAVIILMTPICSGIWDVVPLLKATQFPWRLLGLTSLLQLMLATGLATTLQKLNRSARIAAYAGSIAMLSWISFPQFFPFPAEKSLSESWSEHFKELPYTLVDYCANYEYVPKTALASKTIGIPPRGTLSLVFIQGKGTASPCNDCTKYRISYDLDIKEPSQVLIRQFYFPGWTVRLNGQEIPAEYMARNLTTTGLIRLLVHRPGAYHLQASFGPLPWLWLHYAIIPVALVLFGLLEMARAMRKSGGNPGTGSSATAHVLSHDE